MEKIRLAVLDDHHMVRESLCGALNSWPEGEVMWDAADGDSYEALSAEHGAPDIALVDLCMPGRDGWTMIRWITEHQRATKCIAFSMDPTGEAGWRALQCGALALLAKGDRSAEWFATLVAVRDGGDYLNMHTRRALLYRPERDSPAALRERAQKTLSAQELRFLELYTGEDERSIVETGRCMGVEPSTAEFYRKQVADKTGARKRTSMLRFALRFGLVRL